MLMIIIRKENIPRWVFHKKSRRREITTFNHPCACRTTTGAAQMAATGLFSSICFSSILCKALQSRSLSDPGIPPWFKSPNEPRTIIGNGHNDNNKTCQKMLHNAKLHLKMIIFKLQPDNPKQTYKLQIDTQELIN